MSEDHRSRLAEMRAETLQRITSLRQSFDEIVDAAADVATDDEHDPEGHTIAWERQQVAALLEDATATLTDLTGAEARLADGTYGICETCAAQITSARLDALPATSTCVACAR